MGKSKASHQFTLESGLFHAWALCHTWKRVKKGKKTEWTCQQWEMSHEGAHWGKFGDIIVRIDF